jgi:hypothetical protein
VGEANARGRVEHQYIHLPAEEAVVEGLLEAQRRQVPVQRVWVAVGEGQLDPVVAVADGARVAVALRKELLPQAAAGPETGRGAAIYLWQRQAAAGRGLPSAQGPCGGHGKAQAARISPQTGSRTQAAAATRFLLDCEPARVTMGLVEGGDRPPRSNVVDG